MGPSLEDPLPDHDRWTTFNPHTKDIWHVRWTGAPALKTGPALVAPVPTPTPAPVVKAPEPVAPPVQPQPAVVQPQPAPVVQETPVVHERFRSEGEAQTIQPATAGAVSADEAGGLSWSGIILGGIGLLIVLALILAFTRRKDGPQKS